MLKNIEIVELVDLSPEVGRVLQINFVRILHGFVPLWMREHAKAWAGAATSNQFHAYSERCKCCKRHWCINDEVPRGMLRSDTLIVWSSWKPGKRCLDDFWSLPEAERRTKKDDVWILLIKFPCLLMFNSKYSTYDIKAAIRLFYAWVHWRPQVFAVWFLFMFSILFWLLWTKGAGQGLRPRRRRRRRARASIRRGSRSARHPKNRRLRILRMQLSQNHMHCGLQDSRSPGGSEHRDSYECWACGASDMPHSKNVCPTGVRIWLLNGMFSSCCQVEVLDMIYSLMRILIPSYIFLKFDRYRLIVCICSGIFFLRRLQRISGSHGHGRTDSIKLERLCSYLHYIFVHIFSL